MKNKILSILFMVVIFGMIILGILLPDKEISVSERRKLASFPKFELIEVFNGNYFDKINNYVVEQFPFRDWFRSVKGIVSNYLFQKKDENGVFIKNDSIYQLNTSIDNKSVIHFTNLLNKIQSNYLDTNNVYYSIIPDKNYFLNDEIPKLNYDELKLLLNQNLTDMKYIELFDTLTLDSYYRTDIHWRQDKLLPAIKRLEEEMHLENIEFPTDENSYDNFYGALYSRIANNLNADIITYLTNDNIQNSIVYDYEKNEYRKVYEEIDLSHIDSYDIYLGGAKPLLVIDNKNQENGRELILFRDSFGSSIAPLLISNYSRITLIDLRYISSDMLTDIDVIDFTNEDQDILFLYSVPIINNSFTLK